MHPPQAFSRIFSTTVLQEASRVKAKRSIAAVPQGRTLRCLKNLRYLHFLMSAERVGIGVGPGGNKTAGPPADRWVFHVVVALKTQEVSPLASSGLEKSTYSCQVFGKQAWTENLFV